MKIAVRTPNWLGDTVMALPALSDLVATFPGEEITCFATPVAGSVLAHAEPALAVRTLDRSRGRLRMLRDGVRALRRERFALGIVCPPSFSSALVFRLGRVPVRVGYRGHGRSRLLTHPLDDVPRGETHLSNELRALVAAAAGALGVRPKLGSGTARVTATAASREQVRAVLGGGDTPLVVLAPGALYGPTKRWPPDRFAALADRLAREMGARVVLTGAAADVPVCGAVAAGADSSPLDLSGRTGMGMLIALFEAADLVVSNDSGAMHLAAAAGARVVAVFGSTNPAWTGPLGDRSRIVYRNEACAPCYRRRCPIGEVCLTRIAVDDVFDACREELSGRSGQVVR